MLIIRHVRLTDTKSTAANDQHTLCTFNHPTLASHPLHGAGLRPPPAVVLAPHIARRWQRRAQCVDAVVEGNRLLRTGASIPTVRLVREVAECDGVLVEAGDFAMNKDMRPVRDSLLPGHLEGGRSAGLRLDVGGGRQVEEVGVGRERLGGVLRECDDAREDVDVCVLVCAGKMGAGGMNAEDSPSPMTRGRRGTGVLASRPSCKLLLTVHVRVAVDGDDPPSLRQLGGEELCRVPSAIAHAENEHRLRRRRGCRRCRS